MILVSDFVIAVFLSGYRLVGLVVKASALGVEDQGFESRRRRDCSGSSHTSDVKKKKKKWHSSGYPARRLVLWGQRWDW